MKKSVVAATVIVGLLALSGGVVYASEQMAKSNAIGEENACNFAYVDAGVLPEDVEWVHTEFDYEEGTFVYEIEFLAKGMEYDYTVDSSDGRILHRESEVQEGNTQLAGTVTETTAADGSPAAGTSAAAEETMIPAEEAKEIALRKAGLTADEVTFRKEKLERENGRDVYDLEFYVYGKAEYDYEIDAYTGDILEGKCEEWELDDDDWRSAETAGTVTETTAKAETEPTSAAGQTKAETDIGVERAKSIALENAGLSGQEVVFSKAKLDRDDGKLVYEIEFYVSGQAEYEYEIDAATGAILEADCEGWEESCEDYQEEHQEEHHQEEHHQEEDD